VTVSFSADDARACHEDNTNLLVWTISYVQSNSYQNMVSMIAEVFNSTVSQKKYISYMLANNSTIAGPMSSCERRKITESWQYNHSSTIKPV
jgi:hypothetical protein